jgi:hypothetical protein
MSSGYARFLDVPQYQQFVPCSWSRPQAWIPAKRRSMSPASRTPRLSSFRNSPAQPSSFAMCSPVTKTIPSVRQSNSSSCSLPYGTYLRRNTRRSKTMSSYPKRWVQDTCATRHSVDLTVDQEIDDLIDEWTPEPLVAKTTAFEEADLEKRPVIVGYVKSSSEQRGHLC